MELLDQLTACVGCDYLSDLRFSTASSRTETALVGIPDDAYSVFLPSHSAPQKLRRFFVVNEDGTC